MIAIAVAGWPLYRLVASGSMDATTALVRGAIVVAACGYGVSLIVRLASRFEAEVEAERARRIDELYTDLESAVADGALTAEDGEPGASDEPASSGSRPAPGTGTVAAPGTSTAPAPGTSTAPGAQRPGEKAGKGAGKKAAATPPGKASPARGSKPAP